MSLDQYFKKSDNIYILNNDVTTNNWSPHDFGIVTSNIIIDGQNKNITITANKIDGLFAGGGKVIDNGTSIINESFIEIKNLNITINGNIKCGLIKSSGSVKISNCNLIINGNILSHGGGFVYTNTTIATSNFKSTNIINSSVYVNGNIESSAGPLIGKMSGGNFATITKSLSIVNGNIGDNAGAFVGANVGLSKTTTISGCYCIISGSMAQYSGVIAGSFFGSNFGTVNINNFYSIINIANNITSISTGKPCYISNHISKFPKITLTGNNQIIDLSKKTLRLNDNNFASSFMPVLTSINVTTLNLMNLTYFDSINKFTLYFNNGTVNKKYELPKILGTKNYNLQINSDNKIFNVDSTFLLEFSLPAGITNISLPIGPYNGTNSNATVYWGDITKNPSINVSSDVNQSYSITAGPKVIVVAITGTVKQFGKGTSPWTSSNRLKKVLSFGDVGIVSLAGAFNGAVGLQEVPYTIPSNIVNLSCLFYGASGFNQPINNWNTSGVTNMSSMFSGASSFNQQLDCWDTSSVTDMSYMFYGASAFNQPIYTWITSSVTNMFYMFYNAEKFNQPVNSWNTYGVTNMAGMFKGASTFNQQVNIWNTSGVTNMSSMFSGATDFNQQVSNWNVSAVTDMSSMFADASSFNQPVNNWNVSRVTNMSSMFSGASNFNQQVDNWNTSGVTNMSRMFRNAYDFNQSVNSWNTSQVTNMYAMFYNAIAFDQPLDNWNTLKVTDMSFMFAGYNLNTNFNQDISSWNTSNVTSMSAMFQQNINFNQPINSWNIRSVTNMSYMFYGASGFNQPVNNWNTSGVINMSRMFYGASNFSQPIGYWNFSSAKNIQNIICNNGYDYTQYSQFIYDLSINKTLPNNLSLRLTGKVRLNDFITNNAYDYLTKSVEQGGKNLTISDEGSYVRSEIDNYTFGILPQIKINASTNGQVINLENNSNTIIIDSGGITDSYVPNESYKLRFNLPLESILGLNGNVDFELGLLDNQQAYPYDYLKIFDSNGGLLFGSEHNTNLFSSSINLTIKSEPFIVFQVCSNNNSNGAGFFIRAHVSKANEENEESNGFVFEDVQPDGSNNLVEDIPITQSGEFTQIETTNGARNFNNLIASTPNIDYLNLVRDVPITQNSFIIEDAPTNNLNNWILEDVPITQPIEYNQIQTNELDGARSFTYNNSLTSGGDPIIKPLFGPSYALAPHIKFVNLFADFANGIFINAQVDLLNKADFPKNLYWNNGFVKTSQITHIYSNSYYRRFFIYSNGDSIEIDADTLEINQLTQLNKIKIKKFTPKVGIKSITYNKQYPLLNSTKAVKIGFGKYLLTITSDINTDDRHHLEFLNVKTYDLDFVSGALVSKDQIIKISNIVGVELFAFDSNPFFNSNNKNY